MMQVQKFRAKTRRCKPGMLVVTVAVLSALMVFAGCPRMAEWRDSQIQTSKALAEGNTVMIPNPPITVPGDLYETLPIRDSFIVLKYNKQGREIELDVLADMALDQASIWVLPRMSELGYRSDDNASRVLEGVTYYSAGQAAYSEIHIKLHFVDSGRSLMHLEVDR